jgi:hypothetical protein
MRKLVYTSVRNIEGRFKTSYEIQKERDERRILNMAQDTAFWWFL